MERINAHETSKKKIYFFLQAIRLCFANFLFFFSFSSLTFSKEGIGFMKLLEPDMSVNMDMVCLVYGCVCLYMWELSYVHMAIHMVLVEINDDVATFV